MKQTFGPYQDKSIGDVETPTEVYEVAVRTVELYLKELDKSRHTGVGLTLLGPNGVGKTLLASVVLNEVIQRGYRIEAIELAVYVALHKDKFALHSLIKASDDERIVDEYVKLRQHLRYIQGVSKHSADWVLFDDVGREYPSESGWSQAEFFDTVRSRWNRNLPTLVTSNLPMSELDQRYGEGLSSLLMEATQVILVEGDDFRWRRDN
jgi:DNA replication protein DnaC